ncbi:MAG: hypothetical protein AVDCRST_MAG64-2141, partial [uncultured Phycisphaerae bacterium]
AIRRDLPGRPQQLRAAGQPPVGRHRGEAEAVDPRAREPRRLAAQGVRQPRPAQGLPAGVPEQQRPPVDAPELLQRADHRRADAAGDPRRRPQAAGVRVDGQHHRRRAVQGRRPDALHGRGVRDDPAAGHRRAARRGAEDRQGRDHQGRRGRPRGVAGDGRRAVHLDRPEADGRQDELLLRPRRAGAGRGGGQQRRAGVGVADVDQVRGEV